MKNARLIFGIMLASAATMAAAAAPTIATLRSGHRVLIVSAPAGSPQLTAQRRVLAEWKTEGQERDVATVILEGSKVEGVSDTAASIRTRYAIPTKGFAVALVGKDGHVAYRSSTPVTGQEFDKTIDAMPMRRAGQR